MTTGSLTSLLCLCLVTGAHGIFPFSIPGAPTVGGGAQPSLAPPASPPVPGEGLTPGQNIAPSPTPSGMPGSVPSSTLSESPIQGIGTLPGMGAPSSQSGQTGGTDPATPDPAPKTSTYFSPLSEFPTLTAGSNIFYDGTPIDSHPLTDEEECRDLCLETLACILALHDTGDSSNSQSAGPTLPGGPPGGAPGGLSGLTLNTKAMGKGTCNLFQEKTTPSAATFSWSAYPAETNMFFTITPACKTRKTSNGMKYTKSTVGLDGTVTQLYNCEDGWSSDKGGYVKVTCKLDGTTSTDGGCTKDDPFATSVPSTGSTGSGVSPGIGGIGGGLGGGIGGGSLPPTPSGIGGLPSITPNINNNVLTGSGGLTQRPVDHCVDDSHCCVHGACANPVNGDYQCDCEVGYEGKCCDQDVDECTSISSSHQCAPSQSTCTNTVGSYVCDCLTGWTGTYCTEDIDECLIDQCGQYGMCVNTLGSYNCDCTPGIIGDDCTVDVDECLQDMCGPWGSCINNFGSYHCDCNLGVIGDNCTELACTTLDYEEESDEECVCQLGYKRGSGTSGFNGQPACEDLDECYSSPCHTNADCKNTIGSFSCDCYSGYTGDGFFCEVECPPNSFPNNGDCVCYDGYTKTANGNCEEIQCGPHSHKVAGVCVCDNGYVQIFQDGECEDKDECEEEGGSSVSNSICGQNAKCVNQPGMYECQCLDGYIMEFGDCITDTSVVTCKEHQVLVWGSCTCESGYEWNTLGTECVDTDECKLGVVTCTDGLQCKNTAGSYECGCLNGWSLVNQKCQPSACDASKGYIYYDEANFCIKLSTDVADVDDARDKCKKDVTNGRLAQPNTKEKIEAIEDNLLDTGRYWSVWYMWVDAKQDETEKYYHFFNWGSYEYISFNGEPNDWGDGSQIDFDMFYHYTYWWYTWVYTWNYAWGYWPNVQGKWVSSRERYWSSYYKCVEVYDYWYGFELGEWTCNDPQVYLCEIPINNCPSGFTYDPDAHFCFELMTSPTYQYDADYQCTMMGARLAVTNTDKKLKAIENAMKKVPITDSVFVGGEEIGTTYTYSFVPNSFTFTFNQKEYNEWEDGSMVDAKLWGPGEPNYAYWGGCVGISPSKSYQLSDIPCYNYLAFVCEIPQ